MKIIAYYLPQFHEIKENNLWWGNGFTEWENVRKAMPLYKDHYQPQKPLNNDYYNLMDKKTIEWQTKLANDYGVYGFAYYHYWFNTKKILEKPAENLLKWKDIDQKFCFFWANHDWKRSRNGSSEILIKQIYGNKEEWIDHFNYMKPFFMDERYIKKDNKPILGIFKANDIPNFNEMIKFWNKLCIDIGFNGIYVAESIFDKKNVNLSSVSDAMVIREPDMALQKIKKIDGKIRLFRRALNEIFGISYIYKPSYKKVVDAAIKNCKNYKTEKDVIYGLFTAWDNTARHGKRGYVIESTPEEFLQYLLKIKELAIKNNIEFAFINAWNEWAEGMHLEPDEINTHKYLEGIKEIFK